MLHNDHIREAHVHVYIGTISGKLRHMLHRGCFREV